MSIRLLPTMIRDPSERIHSWQAASSDSEESCCCITVKVPSEKQYLSRRGNGPVKSVRFAPGNGFEGVHEQLFEYETDEHDPKDVWWRSEELREIRKTCKSQVRQVLHSGKQNYELSLEILANSFDPAVDQHKIAFCLQDLKAFSYARALERHIVEKIHLECEDHNEAVLDAQHEIFQKGYLGSVRGALMLKSASRISSKKPRQLALMLAEFDAQEAYRAILSPWEAS